MVSEQTVKKKDHQDDMQLAHQEMVPELLVVVLVANQVEETAEIQREMDLKQQKVDLSAKDEHLAVEDNPQKQ